METEPHRITWRKTASVVFTICRKNWPFSGSPKGAEANAGIYTLIETARTNGLDLRKYTEYILGICRERPFGSIRSFWMIICRGIRSFRSYAVNRYPIKMSYGERFLYTLLFDAYVY